MSSEVEVAVRLPTPICRCRRTPTRVTRGRISSRRRTSRSPRASGALVRTGVAIALPRLRGSGASPVGLAARLGVTMLNAPGTVDAGYRGEILGQSGQP